VGDARGHATECLEPARSRESLLEVDALGFGPGEDRRSQPWWVLARVRAPGGRGARATASGYDAYGTTAAVAAIGAEWLLAGRATRTGVMTPAQAFDPRALLDALAPAGLSWRLDPP